MARRVYPWADGVIAVSEGVARGLCRIPGIPPERVTVIYNPVIPADLEVKAAQPVAHPWLAPGQPPVVLGVGKLKLQKDFSTLLRAFRRVRDRREAHLIIIGEGRRRHHLEDVVRHLGLSADVALPGYQENPFAWMSKASVFVLSSLWEGLPGVLIEAMASGCPVVSTDCPSGPREILLDGALGPLVPVSDDEAMAGAILSVLDAPIEPERLRARAQLFLVDPSVDRYLAVLRDAARRPVRRQTRP